MAVVDRPRLFGSCGVRGVVGDTITRDVVVRLARSLAATVVAGGRVCVGRDTRRSGPVLEEWFVPELMSAGLHVTRLGVVSTPGLYFLTRELGFDAGVAITASHNPPEYNGLKFCNCLGMVENQDRIEHGYFYPPTPSPDPVADGSGDVVDGGAELFSRLAAICPAPLKPQKLVVDCACGPNSLHLPEFLRRQGHEVIETNCTPDLDLCDRDPEPMAKTLGRTIALVRSTGADGGVCYDGDNDRVTFLDREGFVDFRVVNAAMAEIVLEACPGGEIVGSVETGRFVEDAVRRAGGRMHRTVVGDVYIAQAVRDRGAAAGLEECGHCILPRMGYFSSTVYATTLMLAHRDLNELRGRFSDLPPVYTRELRIDCAKDRKAEVMQAVARKMRRLDGQLNTIDGVRVDWEDGWLLVRPSGTSPYMKVNAEALSPERLESLVLMGERLVGDAMSRAECGPSLS